MAEAITLARLVGYQQVMLDRLSQRLVEAHLVQVGDDRKQLVRD
jgi:hypothetical protein